MKRATARGQLRLVEALERRLHKDDTSAGRALFQKAALLTRLRLACATPLPHMCASFMTSASFKWSCILVARLLSQDVATRTATCAALRTRVWVRQADAAPVHIYRIYIYTNFVAM